MRGPTDREPTSAGRPARYPLSRGAALLAALAALAGCHGGRGRDRAAQPAPVAANWRTIVTQADRERLRTWRDAWTQGLAQVTTRADRASLLTEGALLQPDAAQTEPAPPAGDYRCRVVKIGGKGAAGMAYVAYPAFACRVVAEQGGLGLAKLTGSQRPLGRLFTDDGSRLIFLGTMMLGDERRPLAYGRDPERDVAGILERVGARRWRLVMPFPHWESTIDVLELAPADG